MCCSSISRARALSARVSLARLLLALAGRRGAVREALCNELVLRKKTLRVLFRELDADNSGHLDAEELAQGLAVMGLGHLVSGAHGVTQLIAKIDSNQDGKVTHAELVRVCAWRGRRRGRSVRRSGRRRRGAERRAPSLVIMIRPPPPLPVRSFEFLGNGDG